MDALIGITARLTDVFQAVGQQPIDLPQIVVIGSQSSGKSSVLESIVGRDFLPRGTGIVTRRPLVLQLVNVTAGEDGGSTGAPAEPAAGEEWGEFQHLPGERLYDFEAIRAEISRETERITGRQKGISNRPISLKIFSPHVLNLCLVDLPGLTRVAVGDQPADIENVIREMCFQFISNPNAIILAVTPANTDLATSDALQMAQSVDPEGERTIGVLTKLDLMDSGTDALDMLQGRVIPLHRGFVGVVNRGQADINNSVSIRDALKKEQQYFQTHPSYRSIASRMGTTYLAKMLNQVLLQHIRAVLPSVKNKITSMMIEINSEMESLGQPTADQNSTTLGGTLLTLLSKFSRSFCDALEGRATGNFDTNELYGGARISYIFNTIFASAVREVDAFAGLSDLDIHTIIRNANGPRAALFVPEISFELLARRQIQHLLQPGLHCVDQVFDEMQRLTAECEPPELTRFPDLRARIIEVVSEMLRACLGPTQTMIQNLIKIELSYINTNHPDFIGGSRAVAQLMDRAHADSKMQQAQADGAGAAGGADGAGATGAAGGAAGDGGAGGAQGGGADGGAPPAAGAPQQAGAQGGPQAGGAQGGSGGNSSNFFSFLSRRNEGASGGGGAGGGGAGGGGGMGGGGGSAPRAAPMTMPQVPQTMRSDGTISERDRVETEIIKSLLASYFNIVRQNFQDLVPKTIMFFLINHTKEHVQNELVSNLYREDMLDELLRETDDVAARRQSCEQMKVLLQTALGILDEVRDFNAHQ